MKAKSGDRSACRIRAPMPMLSVSMDAPAVRSVAVLPAATSTVRPSISDSSAGTLGAMRSITFFCRASSAGMLTASTTASLAHSALRPLRLARLWM